MTVIEPAHLRDFLLELVSADEADYLLAAIEQDDVVGIVVENGLPQLLTVDEADA